MIRLTRILSRVALAGILATSAMIAAGCGSGSPDGTDSATGPAQAPAVVDTVSMEVDDNTTAEATKFDDGSVRVEIASLDGRVDFTADFRLTGATQTTMAYTFFPPAVEEDTPSEPASNSLDFESGELPTLENAINGTVFVRAQFAAAVLKTYDNWGCDLLPRRFNHIVSCGPKGGCCDRHDACYAANGCTSSSWTQLPWRPCQRRCNIPAAACFLAIGGPGPSVCCALGNCGQPR